MDSMTLSEKLALLINNIKERLNRGERLELELRIGKMKICKNLRRCFEPYVCSEIATAALEFIQNSKERTSESVESIYFKDGIRTTVYNDGSSRTIKKTRVQKIDIQMNANEKNHRPYYYNTIDSIVRICLSVEQECANPDASEKYSYKRVKNRLSAPIRLTSSSPLWRLDFTQISSDQPTQEMELEALDLTTISSYTNEQLEKDILALLNLFNVH